MRPNPPKNSEGVIRKTTKPAKCSARPPSASDRGYSALHRALQRLVQRGLGFLVSFRSQNILDLLRTKSSGDGACQCGEAECSCPRGRPEKEKERKPFHEGTKLN
jgi:hypothetical protein